MPNPALFTQSLPEAHAARVLANLPAAVVVVDGHGRVREANRAARELLADDGATLIDRPWLAVIAENFQPRADDGHEITTRDGRRVNIATAPLDDPPGQIVLIKDITETRVLQSELARNARLVSLGGMVASLAHQIRTPVAGALLYASHLGRADLPSADRARFADKLIARLGHMEHLIQDMLGFANGGGARPRELIAIADLLADAAGGMDAHPRRARLTLIQDCPAPLVLRGDRPALLGALHNLLDNAFDACADGGHVALSARARGDRIEIVVADDGRGMGDATRERVLEPFFTTAAGGTGLGLAVVDTVLRNHDGRVTIDSTPAAVASRTPGTKPGDASRSGTRVCLSLPRATAIAETTPPRPLAPTWRTTPPDNPRDATDG